MNLKDNYLRNLKWNFLLLYSVTELEEALMLSDDEFVAKYGAEKPPKDAVVIFTCLGGQYAQMGADLAKKNGWKK